MPGYNPRASDVHVNRPLTNISIAYTQRAAQFAATRVFPIIPVTNASDIYFLYTKADWLRVEARRRAPGTESAGGGYNVDNTNNYNCQVYAYHKDVPDQILSNSDAPLNPERDATEYVTMNLMLNRDIQWRDAFFTTGKWTGSTTATDLTTTDYTAWSNPASTPIHDIQEEANAVQQNTGQKPNVLAVGPAVDIQLKNHPDIVDRIKYTQRGVVTDDILAALFGVERYVVANATRNTAVEGAAVSMSHIFGKHALLVYAAPSPAVMAPSGGYTFNWTGYLGASAGGAQISRFRLEQLKAWRVEGETAYDMKVVAADCGAFFSSIVA